MFSDNFDTIINFLSQIDVSYPQLNHTVSSGFSQPETAEYGIGQLIWGRLKGYDWWPARVVSFHEAQKAPASPGNHWVKWFGDNKLSMVCKSKLNESFNHLRKRAKIEKIHQE